MFNHLNFFVLLNKDLNNPIIKKLKLDQNAQENLTTSFSKGKQDILDTEIERVEFTGSYKTEQGEINYIENYNIPENIIKAVKNPTSIDHLEINNENILKIKGIFAGEINDSNQIIAFVNFNKGNYITEKGFNFFNDGETFKMISGLGINIPAGLDLLYIDNKLFFWKYWTARQVLDLTEYYREATDEELEEFINIPVLTVDETDKFKANGDSWVRRKVSLLIDSKVFDEGEPSIIAEKAAQYDVDVTVTAENEREQIKLPDEKKDLKEVLRFLDEDYYSGPITETRYLSNSKKKVKN